MRPMSTRAARRVLLLAAILLAPLPMFTFEGLVPVARYLLLAAICVGMRIAEGPGGVVWPLTGLFLAQAAVYGLLLWALAALVGRALRPLSPRTRGALVVVLVAAATLWAVASEPYVTPFGPAARGNLLLVLR